MTLTISQLITKLTEVQNNIGDVPVGMDNGCGISWLEDISENTCYEMPDTNEEIDMDEDGIKFVELKFDTEF